MDFSLRRLDDGTWAVIDNAAGETVATLGTHEEAVLDLAARVQAALATTVFASDAASDEGLLPEWWISAPMADNRPAMPADPRDFSNTTWQIRDVAGALPLMLHDVNAPGHDGARLAGFATHAGIGPDGKPWGAGRYYDSEAGRQARDMMRGGRSFGVSVDPGPNSVMEFVCTDEDPEWGCVDGVMTFPVYEIGGLTIEPFPAIGNASIRNATREEVDALVSAAPASLPASDNVGSDPIAAAGGAEQWRPPRAWFEMPEPTDGDPLLIEQESVDGVRYQAVPLTITDEGQLYGHLCYWGQCHIGFLGRCVTVGPSTCSYAEFLLNRPLVCDDGSTVVTGTVFYDLDHIDLSLDLPAARDAYSHTGRALAAVTIRDGVFGPWVTGAVYPDVPPAALARVNQLSGDWRPLHRTAGASELCAIQAVNCPGFGIRRIAASGEVAQAEGMRFRQGPGGTTIIGANRVAPLAVRAGQAARRSGNCGCNTPISQRLSGIESALAELRSMVDVRTRPLAEQRMGQLRDRIGVHRRS